MMHDVYIKLNIKEIDIILLTLKLLQTIYIINLYLSEDISMVYMITDISLMEYRDDPGITYFYPHSIIPNYAYFSLNLTYFQYIEIIHKCLKIIKYPT